MASASKKADGAGKPPQPPPLEMIPIPWPLPKELPAELRAVYLPPTPVIGGAVPVGVRTRDQQLYLPHFGGGLYWDDGMNLGISPPDFSFGDRISFFMGVGFGGGWALGASYATASQLFSLARGRSIVPGGSWNRTLLWNAFLNGIGKSSAKVSSTCGIMGMLFTFSHQMVYYGRGYLRPNTGKGVLPVPRDDLRSYIYAGGLSGALYGYPRSWAFAGGLGVAGALIAGAARQAYVSWRLTKETQQYDHLAPTPQQLQRLQPSPSASASQA